MSLAVAALRLCLQGHGKGTNLRLLRVYPLLCALAFLSAGAQTPTITANARLVVLDVSVTDAKGVAQGSLTEKDFQVFEDGKLQRIRSVESPLMHVLPASSSAIDTVFDPAQPASFGQSPVSILVLDQLNTHFAESSFARKQMHDYLATQPALLAEPTTLLSVFDDHFKLQQGFTRDRDALLKALAAAPTQYAWKLEINGKTEHGPIERLDQSLRALEEMAGNYARIPGRKNVIWVGGGFPSMDPDALDASAMHEVEDTLRHVTNVLLDARVTLYAVDPTSTAPGMTEITDATQMAFITATGDASGSTDPFSVTADFDKLGPMTGGRVIRARNDVAAQIAESVALGTNFYTISYSPSSASTASAKFRKIRIVVRDGLLASTRSGYYAGATPKGRSATADASYDLETAAETSVPLNGLRVTAEPDAAVPGTYIVKVGAAGLTWNPKEDGSSVASVYVMAVSLNGKNKMVAHVVHPMTATAKAGADLTDAAKMADFAFGATPAPKAAVLRFVVRDSGNGRMGSVDLVVGK